MPYRPTQRKDNAGGSLEPGSMLWVIQRDFLQVRARLAIPILPRPLPLSPDPYPYPTPTLVPLPLPLTPPPFANSAHGMHAPRGMRLPPSPPPYPPHPPRRRSPEYFMCTCRHTSLGPPTVACACLHRCLPPGRTSHLPPCTACACRVRQPPSWFTTAWLRCPMPTMKVTLLS